MILAQEGAEGGSNVQLVLPEPSELIAGIVAFAIVFFFAWKKAVPSIVKTLDKRQAAIKAELTSAEQAKVEAEQLLDDYKQQVAGAKSEASRIIGAARETGEAMRADLEARGKTEAEQIVAKARADAEDEKARVMVEARHEVANLSIDLAEKVIGQSLDRQAQLGLVQRYIADLDKTAVKET